MVDTPQPGIPNLKSYRAKIVGFDVCGFSKIYEKLKAEIGARAGEIVSGRLIRGDRVFSDIIAKQGFRFGETTGDGALYIKREFGEQTGFEETASGVKEASRKFTEATGFSIRTATTEGWINELKLPFKCAESQTFRYGPALFDIHARLSQPGLVNKDRRTNLKIDPKEQVRDPFSVTEEQYCICIKLQDAAAETAIEPSVILSICLRCYQWISALNGAFERISYDEKGVLIRASCSRYATTAESLKQSLVDLQESISAIGVIARMSLNFGSIYRGSGSDGRLFVHGEPINTGTKALTRYSKKIELIGELPEEVSILEAKPSTSLKLVGRNRELATISGKLNSQGFQLCGVFGERGIGKTAILNHIMDYQAQKFGSLSFIKCSPSGALHELGVIGDVIHKATAQLVSKMSIEEVESLILAQLAKDRQNAQHISLFKEILPDEIFRQAIEVPIIRSEKLSLLTGFATSMMRLLSCSKSMLIVIDECHLIDPESERVFGSLAQENANLKILLATREKSQCGLVKHPNLISLAHILTLGPIAKTYFGELFRSIELGPENDWDSVVEVSGGNPFYAIQIAFAKKEGVSSTDQPLDDIVKERLGLLTRPQLMMLRLISCYSRPASTEFLENAASRIGLRDSPTDHLEALVRLRLARRSNSEPLALEVAHGLVSKSVLEISPEGAISSIFETLARSASAKEDSGDRIALEVHELALLWENAQASGRAAILHSRAADIAADKGYFRSAAKFYENAVRQLKSNKAIAARVNSWNVETAECLWAIGDVKGADTSIKRYRRNERFEIKNKRSKDTLARASAIEAETSYFTGNFADLLMAQWRLGKYNLSEGSNELARVRGYASLAYTVGIFRLLPLAHYFANKATKIGLGINNGRSVAHGLAAKGLLFFVFGEWEKGEVAFSEAFSHLSSAVDEQHLFEVIHTLLGLGAHQQGKAQVAKFHFSQLKESAVRRGHKLHEGWVEYSLASLFLSQGKPEQALNHINLADPLIAGKGDLQSQHICAGLHARIHWDLNQRDLALQWAKTAHEFSVKLPPRNFSSIEAYAAPPLIFALARKENHQSPNELDQIIKPLANYAMIFPTARSRFHLIKALVLGATNKSKSKQHIARSQGLREKFRIGSDDNLQAQIKTSLGELN